MVAAGRWADADAPVAHGGVAQVLGDFQVLVLQSSDTNPRADDLTTIHGVPRDVVNVRNGPPTNSRFGAGGAVEEYLTYVDSQRVEHLLEPPPPFLDVLEVDLLHLLEVGNGGHVRRGGGGRHDIPPSCVFSSRCCFQKRKNSPHYISSRG